MHWLFPITRGTWLWHALKRTAIVLYCVAIFLGLDFTVSSLGSGWLLPMQTTPDGRKARQPDPIYHHTLALSFDGVDRWGEQPYRLFTNSLGFKDATTRDIPVKSDTHRILLIGDSFTEGIGLEFQDTFAGMLYRAGRERAVKVDFLNAGVVSYSPTIYYKKIKHLIDDGLQFDEVVVLPDLSDVQDEALFYFCFDDIAEYRARCTSPRREDVWFTNPVPDYWQRHFVLTDRLRVLLKRQFRRFLSNQQQYAMTVNARSGWIFPGFYVGREYLPLGIDGGIERAMRHMQALADLLASRKIPLTVAVYPWPVQLDRNMRSSRQVDIWREFCRNNCKAFVDLGPDVFAAKDAHADWYSRYFIFGDVHYSTEGNRLLFGALQKSLLPPP